MRVVKPMLAAAIALIATVNVVYAAVAVFNHVYPSKFDPGNTFLVQAAWINGIGCPTNAMTFDGVNHQPYTDAACVTGDNRDHTNQGLLLAKTGPTTNDAAGRAHLVSVPSHVTELGYDIRKPRSTADPSGSHCGAGAPRFNVTMSSGTFFK